MLKINENLIFQNYKFFNFENLNFQVKSKILFLNCKISKMKFFF